MKKLFFCLLLIPLISGCNNSETPEIVIDQAGLLSHAEIRSIQKYTVALLEKHDIDFRLILKSNGLDGEAFNLQANKLMEELASNSPSSQGRVILLFIDTKSNLARLEISGDLEGIYTDAFSGYIQQRHMVYFFREQRIKDGVLATTEMIYERAREAALGKNFEIPHTVFAGGGGATAEAKIGGRHDIHESPAAISSETIQAGTTPQQTIMTYSIAMAAGNKNPELDIFTDTTKTMLKNWTVTPVQMRNTAKGIERCSGFPVQIFHDESGRLAVVRYPVLERQCHPWFLQNDAGKWRLDLDTMQKAIRFNQTNQFHFKLHNHPYLFGFTDLHFDKNGYPHE